MTTSQPTNGWDFATRTSQAITLAVVVCVLGWLFLSRTSSDGGNDPTPVVQDPITKVLADCYEADRKSKIAILKGIASNQFADDSAKLEWINSESEKRRLEDFKPYSDRMAEAIFEGKTEKMATDLEAGK